VSGQRDCTACLFLPPCTHTRTIRTHNTCTAYSSRDASLVAETKLGEALLCLFTTSHIPPPPPPPPAPVQVLGGGIDVVSIGCRSYIRSVPGEFNMDKNRVMELAQQQGYISAGEQGVGDSTLGV